MESRLLAIVKGHAGVLRPDMLTMFKRLPILSILLAAAMLQPAAAQLRLRRPMDELRQQLKIKQTDTKKAEILLDLGLEYVLKPGEYANDLDSARLLVQQAEKINESLKNRKIEARAYFVYANAFREGGKTDSARRFIEKALELYKTLKEPEVAGQAWVEMANSYSNDDYRGKRDCFDKARACFSEAGDKVNEAFALKNMGDFDQLSAHFDLAMKELLEALAIYKSIGYNDLQGVYDLLGVVFSVKGDYPDAAKYGLLALGTAERGRDTSLQLCTIYNRLGLTYSYMDHLDESLLYYKKALEVATKYHALSEMAVVTLNICVGDAKIGKYYESIRYARSFETAANGHADKVDSLYLAISYTSTYTLARNFEMAGKYADEILLLLRLHPEWKTQMNAFYPPLIRYYMYTKHNPEALKYASSYLRIGLDNGWKRVISKAYEWLAKVDSAVGDYDAALREYKNYKSCTDSMLNETTSFQIAEKQVEFETEQKDNDIRLLKQQQEIQQSRLKRTRTTNIIVTISIAVLGLVLALLYNRYRVKQRLNTELEVKQQLISEKSAALERLLREKDWLVREIHHRVKNNLQIVMSLLNSQSAYLTDERALSAIRESQNRVQAISLLHQKLYQSENLAVIDMPSYVKEVTEYLADNLDARHRIDFEVAVAPVALDVSQAVPLGLIINEAVTNSIKYAFPNGNKGSIHLSMKTDGDGHLLVTIHDNGIGLPEGYDGLHSPSLGMSLMKGLTKQLDGEFSLINHEGLTVQVNFKPIKIEHNGKEGTDRR